MHRTDFIPTRTPNSAVLGLTLLIAAVAAPAFAGSVLFPQLSATAPETTSAKEELRVVGVPLGTAEAPVDATLVLQPMDVFAPDARITIQTDEGEVMAPRPDHAYYGGAIEGRPGSRAVLALLDRGGVRGVIHDGASWWRVGEVINEDLGFTEILVRRVDPDAGEPFHCGNADLPGELGSLLEDVRSGRQASDVRAAAKTTEGTPSYTAHIAFETDQEYLALFGGNTTDATDYVGDLVALGSMVYTDEVDTSWVVQSVNLWTTTDPWDESPGSCALYEFGKYWNDNNSGIDRTIAHMLSGKSSNSGIAWVGVLCRQTFNAFPIVTSSCVEVPTNITGDEYGGDYGFTGGIDGNLDINNPAPIWDSYAVLHEIGHNFDSPHTHCYNTVGGPGTSIDMCFSGDFNGLDPCYSGPTSLPSGCPGSGSNCGTIMSYCHFLSGGISGNISLTLGESWAFGTLPDRVPDRMTDHVVSQDLLNPGCLDVVAGDLIFTDGFESGDTSAWDSIVN